MSFVLAVSIRIKPDQVDNFMKRALENGKAARTTEPGCKQFDILVDPNVKMRVMLYEVYTDEKAFEAHQQTPHFKKYLAEGVPLLASRERMVWEACPALS
jgi:autoinducer 2-degrading protein